jgi:hypothetical protein
MNKSSLILILISLGFIQVFASHQRAAEISYRHVTGLIYEAKIVTYTYTPSPADRPTLDIYWGDGTYSTLIRTQKTYLPDNITLNVYEYKPEVGANTNRHTYESSGTYTLYMEDPNRNYGIVNIPNSVNVPLYVESQLVINPFLGYNNSPILLNPPVETGCIGKVYYHNPGAYDSDGDSLSYRLVNCKTTGGIDIPGFSQPAASHSFSIHPVSGDVKWETPIIQGKYNIALVIDEWRGGVRIGYMTRDMLIEILPPCIEDDTLYSYFNPAWCGYVSGNNCDQDKIKANYFTDEVRTYDIEEVLIHFGVAVKASPDEVPVKIGVWAKSDIYDIPSDLIGYKTIDLSRIVQDVSMGSLTSVIFTSPVPAPAGFYVGVFLPTTEGDTVALMTNKDGESEAGVAWTLNANDEWLSYSSDPRFLLRVSNSIFPVVKQNNVGLDESHELTGKFIIYPNPASTSITIDLPGSAPTKYTYLTINNLSGQQLIQQQITEPITVIDVSNLTSGLYVVKVTDERTVQVGKVIIDR